MCKPVLVKKIAQANCVITEKRRILKTETYDFNVITYALRKNIWHAFVNF